MVMPISTDAHDHGFCICIAPVKAPTPPTGIFLHRVIVYCNVTSYNITVTSEPCVCIEPPQIVGRHVVHACSSLWLALGAATDAVHIARC